MKAIMVNEEDSATTIPGRSYSAYVDRHVSIVPTTIFYFDPNTLNAEGWKQLGVNERTIRTITHYLQKGGTFRVAEDLKRIYGLSKMDCEKLIPYVRIESAAESSKLKYQNDSARKPRSPVLTPIDINSADTTAFILLPGIGSKLATRIINFREKLGGFYSIDQVGETFGLPDSTFQKIKRFLKLPDPVVKNININTATLEELKTHPYIRWQLAKSIVAYRNEHGAFKSLEELKNIMAITMQHYEKMVPYLKLGEGN
jgi:competence ComEA-like helix-hairpin-helix protein